MDAPLAERMRPKKLSEYIGQSHLLGEGKSLRMAINNKVIPSMIFWGPPGVGKTTLAHLIAEEIGVRMFTLSAISSGVKEVREVIQSVQNQGLFQGKRPILFIDEIHRFSKAQQDSLLGAVEQGIITLIGATTENPSFEVISALLSRCQVYTLKSHERNELEEILSRALAEDPWLQEHKVQLVETEALIMMSGGDARKLLNYLEIVVSVHRGHEAFEISNQLVRDTVQKSGAMFDKDGEMHYDIASAFIKSMRGSDPNAAVYWLARLIAGGEDPKFIARRMLILASEDIGLANPTALIMANNTFQAVQHIGWPECRIILSQCAIYLASSPKGNAAYLAINEAQRLVEESGDLPVPIHLRNAPTKLMKELGYGENYRYAHDAPGNFVDQEFLPEAIQGNNFFHPGSSKKEKEVAELIQRLWPDKYKI
ncbi:MAG: replication-associated recombination protein A [Bacteroidetes bacterium]|nr:MAG: replication-associated recombination protein A [Bacteroidota bacterium]